ncbi:MAG: SusC/RagA family TonB-linked outer membrane protein [Prevotellaceae bacterium]|nr:SusC/RagA family TonB-linked outer membrane protein [Prevotellaceae bacterium]
MNTKKIVLLSCGLCLLTVSATAKDVKGRVTDAATGEPLAGVLIQAYGDNKYSTMSDAKGQYSLTLPDYVSSLYMSLDGQQPVQVAIGTATDNVNAAMYSASYTQTYSAATTALHRATATDFQNSGEQSVDPLLKQRLSGDMRMVSRGGNDGLGNVMFIGGLGSLSANTQPLIVLDGVVMDMQYDRSMLHEGYFNNILANIDVNDIDKVEVLKNGTALYGAKGANGVILITTKRSRSMATKIDVTISGKFQTKPRVPSMMGATDYRTYATEMLSSELGTVEGLRFLVSDPSYYYYPQYHNETDWNKEVTREAFAQSYGINVQGGDDVANYNLSVGYTSANSTLKSNDFSRFNMRLNTDINVLKNLSVRFDASFSDVKRDLRDIGLAENVESTTVTSPNFLSLIKSPFLSPYAHDLNGNVSNYLAEADDYLEGMIITSDRSLANPVSLLENGDGENRNTFGNRLVTFSVTPKWQIRDNLSVQEAFNFTLVNTNENYYLPITGVPSFRVPGLSDIVYVDNTVQSLAARQNAIQSDTRVDWNNRYGAHAIKVYGGMRFISNNYKLNVQRGYNTGNDKTPNMSTSLTYKSTYGVDDEYRDITWYANADYNYAEKYYLSASLAAQTSSRFGEDADGLDAFGTVWGIFPSLQGSYVISNEPWMADIKAVNYLRLNLGYDVSGNDDIDYTASRTYFVAKSMLDTTVDGKLLGNVGNNTLKWETTRRLTYGLEGNFFNNRLHLGLTLFHSWTSDLLTLRQMAWTSGLDENWANGGKLRNSGFDINVGVKAYDSGAWHWEVGASMGHYKNKVTALGLDNKSIETSVYGATVLTSVGNPVGMFYGYRTNGVFSTAAEAAASGLYQLDESGNKVYFQAGDMKFQDTDGNGCIDNKDRVIIGDPNPSVYGNIYSRLNWKRWTLDMTMTYSLGNDIFNYERSIIESGKYFYNQTTAMNRRWTTEGQVTDIPRAHYQDPHGNARFSDRWIEDGSYLRLSNVTLSYALPLNSTFIQGITVWGSAQNLFTITKYLGSNPDCALSGNVLSQGIDRGLLGVGRSFAMGLKINL